MQRQRAADMSQVKCYTCGKPGHFSCNCYRNMGGTCPSNRQGAYIEETQDAQISTTQTTPQSTKARAYNWLSGMAQESDKVKDKVFRELWKKEDFQSARTQHPG